MKFLVKIFVVVLLACSCIIISDTQPINSNIEIEMREILGGDERSLEFDCKTTEIYSCMNFPIDRRYSVKPESISIRFKNVIDPGICATALGPATTTINLGNLLQGAYKLDIQVAGSRNSGNLIVTVDQYIIEIANKKQLVLKGSVLNRVPSNTIWGTIGYHQTSSEPVVNEFISSLQESGASGKIFPPGDYGYFSIDESGIIETPTNHGYYFIRTFIFEYSGMSENLKNIVRAYGLNHEQSMSIMLYTSRGEIFRSWMMQQ